MSASPASKPVHSGTDAAKVARLTTRPPQRSASSWRRGTSRRISSAPTAGRKVTTVSRPIGGRLICLCGGPRDGPPASSSEGGYAPLGLPRPMLGRAPAQPWRASGLPQDGSSVVVGGAPQGPPPPPPRRPPPAPPRRPPPAPPDTPPISP